MANPPERPWMKSWAARRNGNSAPGDSKPASVHSFQILSIYIYIYIIIVICPMKFAPDNRSASAHTLTYCTSPDPFASGLSSFSLELGASHAFSTRCGFFTAFRNARPLFSTTCGLFFTKQGYGVYLTADFAFRGVLLHDRPSS
jgi:hypothetical protein